MYKTLMRRALSVFLVVVMLFGCVPASGISMKVSAETLTEGDWTYEVREHTLSLQPLTFTAYGAVLTGYSGAGGDVVIPEQLGGYDVIAIGSKLFYNNKSLTSIVIPDSVIDTISGGLGQGIGYNFSGCSNLQSVTFGNGLAHIGHYTFENCTSLTEIDIPDSVIYLDGMAFQGCSNLKKVTVGYGAGNYGVGTAVQFQVFANCTSLESITFKNPGKYGMYGEGYAMSPWYSNTPKLTTIYGYPGSTAEDFAKDKGKTFVSLGDVTEQPLTLFFRNDQRAYKGIRVTNEFGQTKRTDAQGKVVFTVATYDPQKTYSYVVNNGSASYQCEVKGTKDTTIDFRSFKVHVVQDDGNPVANATVNINAQNAIPQKTDANGIAQFAILDTTADYLITVETDEVVGQTEIKNHEILSGDVYIDISQPSIANPTITGKITHNGSGISGVVLTAQTETGALLYAQTKIDGSYRFVLPKEDENDYNINVIDLGGYEHGIIKEKQKFAVRAGSQNNDFVFENGITLNGTVTDTKNNLLPEVSLYLEKDGKTWSIQTNETGQYQFPALESGTYKLSYGKTGYIYASGESIKLDSDTVKDILLTGYSVTYQRNITYDISARSPVELGEKGRVSVRCQNMDYTDYNNLILEVNIPDGVIINDDMLGAGQHYDAAERKVIMSVDLSGKGDPDGNDFAVFSFMYMLESGYAKNKVIFTAFAREEAAAATEPMSEYEITDFTWSRTDESKTITRKTSDPVWKWSDLSGLTTTLTDSKKIWDGQNTRYFSMYASGSNITKDYATWQLHATSGIEYRRFKSGFTRPNEVYEFSHILSENYEAYSGSGAVFPINDEVFIFVYPKGTTITDANAKNYLAFWGSTQYDKYSGGKFMGVAGNKAMWYKTTGVIPALQHTDYWVLDGTKNRIKEILEQNAASTEFVIDAFASDNAQGGGMDKFNLVFTNTEIPSLDAKKPVMPYKDFIGVAHADLFQPTLTGAECVTAEFARNSEYELSGQSMQKSDVKIYNLSTGAVAVDTFQTEGCYSNKGTSLPPVGGTYAFIAESTKGDAKQYSNIHVVEVIEEVEVSSLRLTSATLKGVTEDGAKPFVTASTLIGSHSDNYIKVSATFNDELRETDEVYYKMTDVSNSFPADSSLGALLPLNDVKTKYVSVVVMREGNIIFSQVIGRIFIGIDPSGYVYDKHTQKRIEGAVATCYVLNENSEWEIWDAKVHGQQNPQITDAEGKYGWDVPEGVYKVTVSKDGFEDYDTMNDVKYADVAGNESLIVIPPPRMDINMGIKNISKPEIISSFPENSAAISPQDVLSFEFNKAMDINSLKNGIQLSNESGTVALAINSNKTRDVVTVVPQTPLVDGEYTVTFANTIEDYVKEKNLDSASFAFTVSDGTPVQRVVFTAEEKQLETNSDGAFTIHFNHVIHFAVNPEGEANKYATLTSDANEEVAVSLFLGEDKKSLIVKPKEPLQPSSEYTLVLFQLESEDGQALSADTITITTLSKAAAPTADTPNGTVAGGKKVTLTTSTQSADIRYTTDGSTPTEDSAKYDAAIEIDQSTVIKAAAFKANMASSDVAIFEYTVGAIFDEAAILGPASLTLKAGYAAASTGAYSLAGTEPITVTKTSGNSKITWNNTTKKLDIAAGLAAGTYPVVLTASNGGERDATLTFTLTVTAVTQPPTITVKSVTVSPKSVSVQKGKTKTFSAAVSGTNNPDKSVKWEITGNKAKGTKISAKGVLTIAANETAKKLTITAISKQDKTKSGKATVTVKTPKTSKPDTKAVPKSKAVKAGTKITLKAPKDTILYYTTDGKKPTTKSKSVKAGKSFKLKINKKTTVKVLAVKKNCSASEIVTRTYKIK